MEKAPMRPSLLTGVIFLSLFVPAADGFAGIIYWSENGGGIRAANLDGSNVTNIVAGNFDSFGMVVDQSAKQPYWTNSQ